jgi:hypothetical protein
MTAESRQMFRRASLILLVIISSNSVGKRDLCRFLKRTLVILTDNGIDFSNRKKDKYAFTLLFDCTCEQHTIDHHLTRHNHP